MGLCVCVGLCVGVWVCGLVWLVCPAFPLSRPHQGEEKHEDPRSLEVSKLPKYNHEVIYKHHYPKKSSDPRCGR